MGDLIEIGALTMEQVRRHQHLHSLSGYWQCQCGMRLAHDYKGSEKPVGLHEEHRNEELGRFVELIAKDYARRLGCPS
jgi:hypothetical protein